MIMYEDSHIVIINKPSGLLSIRDGYDPSLPNVHKFLQDEFGDIWTVHRLDKETSGVIIFARHAVAHKILNQQFQQREIKKQYFAIVNGIPELDSIEITLPLLVNGDRKHRTIIQSQKGKPATTLIQIQEKFSDSTLVSAMPLTGYRHQIRVHLAHIGYPILFDRLYNNIYGNDYIQGIDIHLQRLALHAFEITFRHPDSGESISFHAPIPADFIEITNQLKK